MSAIIWGMRTGFALTLLVGWVIPDVAWMIASLTGLLVMHVVLGIAYVLHWMWGGNYE